MLWHCDNNVLTFLSPGYPRGPQLLSPCRTSWKLFLVLFYFIIPLDTCQRKQPGKPTISIATQLVLSPCLSLLLALSLLRFPFFFFFFLHPQHCPQIRQGFSRGGNLKLSSGGVFFFFFNRCSWIQPSLPLLWNGGGFLKIQCPNFCKLRSSSSFHFFFS